MAELRHFLERESERFELDPALLGRVFERRDRRERRRRTGAVLAAVLVLSGGAAGIAGLVHGLRSEGPLERISPANAHRLGVAWTADVGPLGATYPPVLGDGLVLVT